MGPENENQLSVRQFFCQIKQQQTGRLADGELDLTNYKLLHPWVKFSTMEHGLGDGLLHVLIEPPAGEPIQ